MNLKKNQLFLTDNNGNMKTNGQYIIALLPVEKWLEDLATSKVLQTGLKVLYHYEKLSWKPQA